ncbi:MAG: ComEC/Rec2 family competence protein [Propionibacteriaceae bacterium]|nr:ComEC/Rec2 family competence protein [Propionibacteriaceae bacterium]
MSDIDLRLVAVAAMVWAATWSACQGKWWSVAVAGATVIVGLLAWRGAGLLLPTWRGRRVAVFGSRSFRFSMLAAVIAGGAALLITTMLVQFRINNVITLLAEERAVVDVVLDVSSDPVTYPPRGALPARTLLQAELRTVVARGSQFRTKQPIILVINGSEVLVAGQRVQLTARAMPVELGDGVAAQLRQMGAITVLSEPGLLTGAVNKLRAGLRDSMAWSSSEQAGLVPALVVGDVSQLPSTLVAAFRATGLSHLTAVSGTNLTLLLAFVLLLARYAGARGWWLRGIALSCVVGFVALCRGEPSVLRAAAMGVVALSAIGVARDTKRGIRQLAVAVTALLLIDPWLSHSWGFALSVSATGGIVWWAGRWQDALATWCPLWLAEAVAVPLAAQLATQPLVTALNGQVSLVGILANLAAGSFVGPVTVIGLAATLVSPVLHWLAKMLGWVAGWCVQPIIYVANVGAGLPGAVWQVGATALVIVVMTLLSVTMARMVPWVLSRATASLTAVALLVGVVCVRLPTPGWPGDWAMVFCDVGQGDATVLRGADGEVVLVDGGPEPDALHNCLDELGVKALSLVVLTHQHSDHLAGLAGLGERYRVGTLLLRAGLSESQVNDTARFVGATNVSLAQAQQRILIGEITWVTLASGAPFAIRVSGDGEDPQENNAGTIAVAYVQGLSVLLSGDAEPEAQEALLAAVGVPDVVVLKVPHHGSANQSATFLNAAHAEVAIASVGADNGYGHPAARTVETLVSSGAQVWRTDENGSIAVGIVDSTIKVIPLKRSP